MRIAHPWGLLGVPKGNMLSEALASEGVRAAMSALQGAIVQQLLGPLQPQIGPLPGVLLDQVRSPLELAVLRPAGAMERCLTSCSWYSYIAPTETPPTLCCRRWRKWSQTYS